MPREAIYGSTPYIDASDIWRDIKRNDPSMTADEVAREKSGVVRGAVNGVPIAQTILFDSTPCHFGGSRLWLLCPDCECRVRVLYCPTLGYRFLCRHCHNLTYRSCNRSRLERFYPSTSLWFSRLHRSRSDINVN